MKVSVTSPGFSQDSFLRNQLNKSFKNTKFNIDGKFFSKNELIEFLHQADAAIVGLEIFDKEIIDNLPNLKYISKYGVGLDNIDLEYAAKKEIYIGWEGGLNCRSVSEQTLSFILSLISNQFYTCQKLKKGEWFKKGGNLLTGKIISIIGCGYIGTDLIKLLTPFNCKIQICDVINKSMIEKKYNVSQVDFIDAITNADIVTMHVPKGKDTYHMIDKKIFELMRTDAFLINASRGSVVNQIHLKNALIKGDIAGAALDVFEDEPPMDLEFLSIPNLMVTPHIGGSALESIHKMGLKSIEHLIKYFHV